MAFLGEADILPLSCILKKLGEKFLGISKKELNRMIHKEEILEKIGIVKRLTISKNMHKLYFSIVHSGKFNRIMVRYYLKLEEENLLSKQLQVTNPDDYLLWEKARQARRKKALSLQSKEKDLATKN